MHNVLLVVTTTASGVGRVQRLGAGAKLRRSWTGSGAQGHDIHFALKITLVIMHIASFIPRKKARISSFL